MKFSIVSVALLAALVAMCLSQIQANDAQESTTPATYFGVDANDAEAVRAKQRELSEAKFRELFGDDAHEEFSRLIFEDKEKEAKDGWSMSDVLKKISDCIKKGKEALLNKTKDKSTTVTPDS